MESGYKALLLLCLCLGFACGSPWGRVQDSARDLTMERAYSMVRDFSNRGHASSQGKYGTFDLNRLMNMLAQRQAAAHASQSVDSVDEGGPTVSVRASPHPTTVTTNTEVVLLRNASGDICYFSALPRCCPTIEESFEVGQGRTVRLGPEQVTVRYFYLGGFGSDAPLRVCPLLPASIKICENTYRCDARETCEDNPVCVDNILQSREENCDPVTGCQCQEGFLRPECCECDINGEQEEGFFYYRQGDQCLRQCREKCVRGSPGVRCQACLPGYRGDGCCECDGDRVKVGEDCVCRVGQESRGICCPEGEEESNGRCCPIGEQESNGVCCPVGSLESGGICCRSGEAESNGICCPLGESESNGICCGPGEHGSNGKCCPLGTRESNGVCCPSNQFGSRGICCRSGEAESNGICCPLGESESNGVCCPLGTRESNGVCCPSNQFGSRGICCPSGEEESNGICCRLGTRESNGVCCPSNLFGSGGICCPRGESESNGICCGPGEHGSNGKCCPLGSRESNGVCCPSNRFGTNGICCPAGQVGSNQVCCPPGQTGSRGICCPSDQEESNRRCCPIGHSESNGICCPAGEEESNRRCCPTGQHESNGRCCPIGEEESNDVCCPPGFAGNDDGICEPVIPCGKNQDIVFVFDTTQSFSTVRARRIIRAIQLMVGALDNNDNGLRAAAVKFPPKATFSESQQSSLFIVPLEDADCTVAVKNLDKLSFYLDRFQSGDTDVYESLEFLSTEIDPEKSTAVITITSGISDGYEENKDSSRYPPNAIQAAMSMNKFSDARQVRFFAIGDTTYIPAGQQANFEEELDALSNHVPANKRKISSSDDRGFINEVLSFLQESNILCKEQVEEIQGILNKRVNSGTPDLVRYTKCVTDEYLENYGNERDHNNNRLRRYKYTDENLPPCYTEDTCIQNMPARAMASDSLSLEFEILQAVEQVLSERGMEQK